MVHHLLDVWLALVLDVGLGLVMLLLRMVGSKGSHATHRGFGPRPHQPASPTTAIRHQRRGRLGRPRKLVRRGELGKLLAQQGLHHLVGHSVVADKGLPRVLGVVSAAVSRALVWLGRRVWYLTQQLLFQVLVAHVLPEGVARAELHITVVIRTLDRDV